MVSKLSQLDWGGVTMGIELVPYIKTGLSADELRRALVEWSPWRHEICFSNGVRTSDLETLKPFNPQPWSKIKLIENHLDFQRGGAALDIGCNAGYNALYLRQFYAMNGIGIDWDQRHVDASKFLHELAGYKEFEFLREDACFFQRPNSFDLILHFGTLYHLKHPILSLESCVLSLRSGGWLALETQCYGEETECLYIRGDFNDKTNWFALGPLAVMDILEGIGLTNIKETSVWRHESLGPHGSRRQFIAQKPL